MFDKVNAIKNKEDFLVFISEFRDTLIKNPDSWTNNDLSSYLEDLSICVEGMEQFYINTKQTVPENIDWKVFADILIAAKMYK